MKFRRTYRAVKLEKPWPARWGDPEKAFGIEEVVEGKVVRIIGEKYDLDAFETLEQAEKEANEKNHKFYISDFADEEIEAFFNGIDFSPLYKKVEETTGFKDLTYTKGLKKNRFDHHDHFFIESEQNLAETNIVLRAAWKCFKIATFNASVCVDGNGNLYLWGNLSYSYKHQDGGSNGANIIDFTFKDGKFEMMSAEEQRKMYTRDF